MSLSIPSSFDFGVDLGLDISGIPTNYSISIDKLPTINIDLKPIEIKPLEIKPIDLSLRLKELPSIRAHFPVDFKVGFGLFGAEIACIHFCGQAQAITEPYVPYPCEPHEVRQPLIAVPGEVISGQVLNDPKAGPK